MNARTQETLEKIIVFGGLSRERMVSVASAQNCAQSLPDATLWHWSQNGFVHSISHQELQGHKNPYLSELTHVLEPTFRSIEQALNSLNGKKCIIVNALHGLVGEDGTFQEWLEARNICFTGSSAEASRLSFNKLETKARLLGENLTILPSEQLCGTDISISRAIITSFIKTYGSCIIKPVADGSSFGTIKITNDQNFEKAVQELDTNSPTPYMIEPLATGRELSIGVVETEHGLSALPCTEVVYTERGRDFDYAGKYLASGTKEITPAEISKKQAKAAQDCALIGHKMLGLSGYSRTDLIMQGDTHVYLETNSLPGLSAASFIPQQLNAVGISMADFLNGQIVRALIRQRKPSVAKQKNA